MDAYGWTVDMIEALWKDKRQRDAVESIILSIANNALPSDVAELLRLRLGLAIDKPHKPGDFRFVSWNSMFVLVTASYVMALCDTAFLRPLAFAPGTLGVVLLVHTLNKFIRVASLQEPIEGDPFVILKVDIWGLPQLE